MCVYVFKWGSIRIYQERDVEIQFMHAFDMNERDREKEREKEKERERETDICMINGIMNL